MREGGQKPGEVRGTRPRLTVRLLPGFLGTPTLPDLSGEHWAAGHRVLRFRDLG